MTRTFTTYMDALNAVAMIEMYAMSNGMPFPQFSILPLGNLFQIVKD